MLGLDPLVKDQMRQIERELGTEGLVDMLRAMAGGLLPLPPGPGPGPRPGPGPGPRRGPGPKPAAPAPVDLATLGTILARLGIVDPRAVQDPEGYDGHETAIAIARLHRELTSASAL
jgi:hypothetical protein